MLVGVLSRRRRDITYCGACLCFREFLRKSFTSGKLFITFNRHTYDPSALRDGEKGKGIEEGREGKRSEGGKEEERKREGSVLGHRFLQHSPALALLGRSGSDRD